MNVAFRVDASSDIGSGHFYRCLTLAHALQECGWQIRFISRHLPDDLKRVLDHSGFAFSPIERAASRDMEHDLPHAGWLGTSQAEDAADTIHALSGGYCDWLIVDHYALDERWERKLRHSAQSIAVIDDLANRSHDCDLLIDHNLHTDAAQRYAGKVPAGCRLLLGPTYVLLGEQFRAGRRHVKPRDGEVRRILIVFGDTDGQNYTGRAIAAMAGLRRADLHVDVMIGAGNPRRDEIGSECARHGFVCRVYPDRVAEMMSAADLAIGAGGSSTWERCCLGLPTLAICAGASEEHQIAAAARDGLLYAPERTHDEWSSFIRHHVAMLMDNPFLRTAMSRACMRAVDGEGVWRIVRNLTRKNIELRTATVADSDNLFNWRNDPAVRAASRIPDIIDRKTHQTWVASSVSSVDRILLIGEHQGTPVGVVRFDLRGDEAEISIYLVPGAHPPGEGRSILRCAEQWLAANRPEIARIRARVLAGNERSARLFLGSGYIIEFADYSKKIGPR